MKHYSIGLLLLGMGLVAGSCVPIVQTIASGADSFDSPSLILSPDGGARALELPESLVAVPVIRIEPVTATLRYDFSITGPTGRSLLREQGKIDPDTTNRQLRAGDGPRTLELRFHRFEFPAGRSVAKFEAQPLSMPIGRVEMRLTPVSTGLITGLATALVLAILGWLTASLGALQWIRAEAGRPVSGATGTDSHVEEARIWTTGCHLSALLGYVLPFGHLIGPSAIWLWKRHVLPGVEQAGRDVLNFQLSVTLYVLAGLFLSFFLIGLVVLFLVVILHFSMVVLAALRAQRGEVVRYPLVIRFI